VAKSGVVDSTNFPIAKDIAAALVTLKPGALREMHWQALVQIARLGQAEASERDF
jgi:oxalate decarboxylase/phosphoglucose isomerase-like protein (cupin superfamily)